MAPYDRLQIAAKIHFFLKRELGQGIDLDAMLHRPDYAGEVLALCDRARGTRLEQLGQAFRKASAQGAAARGAAAVPQPWSRDTSGFGL